MMLEARSSKKSFGPIRFGATVGALAAMGFCSSLMAGPAAPQKSASHEPEANAQDAGHRKSRELQPGQQTFSAASDAAHALVEAIQKNDQAALLKILGPNAKDIISS